MAQHPEVPYVKPSHAVLDQVKAWINAKPIFVARKSDCPYSKKTLETLFDDLHVPKDKVLLITVDEIENGAEVKQAIIDYTGQKTVPNTYINGRHIGGNDDLQKLKQTGELQELLRGIV
ncbi:hypothetical protein TBLA_0A05080 [Henningerozyma blattae CBS 6284]|uniref:Glutaredoxin domain-containing protein n=1 Tax=Henningerozyma blattae (strain ATCC 34711 / CBS 6284 / DSM 70876 / NBRC 10599 / NRRL Y-10934 / UCD 77-7) TaxID=1071380 RepID=I2GVZ9_HENB6|nr:hypothetical protein TBLA_0A05080 [Tetrapisispora blattae CBS 6284]CCH58301.1 hypothetical protein TBLA_0A05080 [Tetrapisispora blattae CBS 6284]